MGLVFAIQASCPRSLLQRSADDENLGMAIETVFPLETEIAFVVWNSIYVPLSYKYDVSILTEQVLWLHDQLMAAEEGKLLFDWPSNTFATRWTVAWKGDALRIDSRWSGVRGGLLDLLNGQPTVEIGRQAFFAEWRALLERVDGALRRAGYDANNLPEMSCLTAFPRRERRSSIHPEKARAREDHDASRVHLRQGVERRDG